MSDLIFSTGNTQVDGILSGFIQACEDALPGRVKAYYLTGSYAYGSPVPTSDIDLNVVVRDLLPVITRLLGSELLVRDSLADAPVVIRADRAAIEQVVLNLAINSSDAMSNGGTITLLGDLNRDDMRDADRWKTPLRRTGWALQCEPAVTRKQTLDILRQADGLLLLSVLRGVIPLKLFEYIHVKKPILAVTEKAGAVWRVSFTRKHCWHASTDYS